VLLASAHEGKALLVCALSQALVGRDLSASALLQRVLPIVGGKGGGRPAFARGGGPDAGKIAEALEAGRQHLAQRLQAAGQP
jgi:alanyl-tRNA synthetase